MEFEFLLSFVIPIPLTCWNTVVFPLKFWVGICLGSVQDDLYVDFPPFFNFSRSWIVIVSGVDFIPCVDNFSVMWKLGLLLLFLEEHIMWVICTFFISSPRFIVFLRTELISGDCDLWLVGLFGKSIFFSCNFFWYVIICGY